MTIRLACLAAFVLCAAPVAAEQIGPSVASDLDGDGVKERFTLVDAEEDYIADLVIEGPAGRIVAKDVAWRGGPGQTPGLALAPNGSLRVMSLNEAIGRNRWFLTLTVAYRRGAYRVAGYTYEWYDTLAPSDNGVCDLNLLTGGGNLSKDGGPEVAVTTDVAALPVTEWRDDMPIPKACGLPE